MGPSATGWKIGEVSVTPVIELEMPTSADFILPDATPENLARHPWLRPHFVDDEGQLLMIVQALLVESRGPREEVDLVVCTHLHVDHVGWNTMLVDDHWVPTFPNARYVVARPEWDYWREEDDQFFGDVLGDSVRPIFDAGLVDLVDVDHRLTEEVRLDPTPGHTPGHCSVIISSGSDEAVITGDLMHHPSQCAHPEWASSADVDANRARQTRRMFLARYAGSPVLVIGTHWGRPTAGHIVRDGEAWRFVV
jgi:glyoxylase-like metal-dependent hydrolase (beta-lactamase superfamily II)